MTFETFKIRGAKDRTFCTQKKMVLFISSRCKSYLAAWCSRISPKANKGTSFRFSYQNTKIVKHYKISWIFGKKERKKERQNVRKRSKQVVDCLQCYGSRVTAQRRWCVQSVTYSVLSWHGLLIEWLQPFTSSKEQTPNTHQGRNKT